MFRLGYIFTVLVALAIAVPAQASTGEPDRFLKEFADRAIASLTEEGVDRTERAERFADLLEEGFDIPEISQFVTARYWREASDDQKADFIDAFNNYLVQRFLPLFDDYTDQPFEPGQVRQDNAEADAAWITVALQVSDGTSAVTEWKVKKKSANYKIVDVKAEGTSMLITLRDEFQSFMQRKGGLDALIKALRKQADKASAAADANSTN